MSKNKVNHPGFCEDLFENTNMAMVVFQTDTGDVLAANPAAQRLYEMTAEQIASAQIDSLLPVSGKTGRPQISPARFRFSHSRICTHQTRKGQKTRLQTFFTPVKINDQDAVHMATMPETKKQKIEQDLEDSRQVLDAVLNATRHLVFLFDDDGNIIHANDAAAQVFDKTPDELISQSSRLFISENNFSKLRSIIRKVLETQDPIEFQTDIGSKAYDIHVRPVFNLSRKQSLVCAFIHDIHALREYEKAGIAFETVKTASHQMNQPLQVMIGNLELLQMNLADKDSKSGYIQNIMEQLEKLGEIARQLADITRLAQGSQERPAGDTEKK